MDTKYNSPDYTAEGVNRRVDNTWYKKLSWGAVFAGVLIALVFMLLLNLLGIGIGLGSINPTTEQNPMSGLGTGAIIWWVASNVIAIFAGGYIAAKLSGKPIRSIGVIHGLLTWCVYTLISFWLLTTALGGIISGVGSVISQTLSTVGSGVESIVGGSNGQNQQQDQNQAQSGLNVGQITSEIRQILRQTDDPGLQPDSIEQAAEQNYQNIRETLNEENLTNQDIQGILQQLINQTQNLTQKIDRNDVVNVITARTDLSEQEVNNVADVIVTNVENAQQKINQMMDQAGEEAQQVAEKAAETASSAAIWSFFALIVGMGAAIGGGAVGTTKREHSHDV